MNEWVSKSIELANAPGYLDRLHAIYPVIPEVTRPLPVATLQRLAEVYAVGDDQELVRTCLLLPKFPVKDPYVAFLRKREKFLEQNPQTVHRLAQRIRALGYEGLMIAVEEPKEFNRQMGTLFKRWLPSLGYPFLEVHELERYLGIAFLQGSDRQLLEFANRVLGCSLTKAPDWVAKVGRRYAVGEVKFLTDYGGHQYAQLEDALRFLRGRKGRAVRVAVLDGVVWIRGGSKMYRTVCQLEEPALSALLLSDFLETLGQGAR